MSHMPSAATLPRRYTHAEARGREVWLDDKQLLTPAQASLTLPSVAMAAAVAAEWNAQGEKIAPATMPLTQLAMTAIDRVAPQRDVMIAELAKYLGSELICHYGADDEVLAFQKQRWQPVHAWLGTRFGVALPVTYGINPLRGIDDAWAVAHMQALDDFRLTALQQAVAVLGSFALGLALTEGVLSPQEALDAAEAEGDYQAQRWGMDEGARLRRESQLAELASVKNFADLLEKQP